MTPRSLQIEIYTVHRRTKILQNGVFSFSTVLFHSVLPLFLLCWFHALPIAVDCCLFTTPPVFLDDVPLSLAHWTALDVFPVSVELSCSLLAFYTDACTTQMVSVAFCFIEVLTPLLSPETMGSY